MGLHFEKLISSANKRARNSALEHYIKQGRIRFIKRHRLLLDQLRMFPLGVHDDGSDAPEMACQGGLRLRNRTTVEQLASLCTCRTNCSDD